MGNDSKMEMLSKNPKSEKLKSEVSGNLLHFLGDNGLDSDTLLVLTDYIIVLICNGKTQDEVKTQLHPFLGEKSEEFVTWLWDFLPQTQTNTVQHQTKDLPPQACKSLDREIDEDNVSLECVRARASVRVRTRGDRSTWYAKDSTRSPQFSRFDVDIIAARRLFTRATGAIFHQHSRQQSDVLKRLGKQSEDDNHLKADGNGVENTERGRLECDGHTGSFHSLQDCKSFTKTSDNPDTKTVGRSSGWKRKLNGESHCSIGDSGYSDHNESVKVSKTLLPKTTSSINSQCASSIINPEEGIESRTVFVTNVHIAATKEALSYYFNKCGNVVRVIKLTIADVAHQEGAAYISFSSNKSVEKALALSGTLFFTKIIRVRKAGKQPE